MITRNWRDCWCVLTLVIFLAAQPARSQVVKQLGEPNHRQEGGVTVISISLDGYSLAVGYEAGYVALRDVQTLHLEQTFTGHQQAVSSVAFSPDGRQLATGSFDQSIRVWHIESAQLIHTLVGHPSQVKSLTFSDDAKFLASSGADGARLWDVESGALVQALPSTSGVPVVAFSPDGTMLASAGRTVMVWDTRTGTLIRELASIGNQSILALDFSQDGSLLVGGGTGKTVHVWNTQTGELRRTSDRGEDFVRSLTFSDDETVVAADRKAVRTWDLQTLGTHAVGADSDFHVVALSRSGTLLVAALRDGTIKTRVLDR